MDSTGQFSSDEEKLQYLAELEKYTREIEVREIERDLRKYIPLAWPIIEPHRPYVPNWHLDVIADHLMACSEGHIQNLVINIPPRHMKSLTVSVFWPSWEWCTRPHIKGLFVSYSKQIVVRDAVKTRRILSSQWYQELWGHKFNMSTDQNVKSHFENDQGGVRLVGSMDAGVTGEGGDRLVVDDPTKLEDADNQGALDHVQDFWDGVLSSRINDPATGIRVVIMQRLNERDLTGHILSKERDWVHLFLPTEYEASRRCVTFYFRNVYTVYETKDKVTGEVKVESKTEVEPKEFQDIRTKEGELLNPKRFGPKEVDTIKQRLGPWKYAGQQQQRPVPAGGGLFQRDWWQFYLELPGVEQLQLDAAQSWDLSFKDLETSSYVVGLIGARVGPNIYILWRRRDRLNFPNALEAIRGASNLYPWVGPKLVEDKANGPAAISILTSEIPGMIARPVPQGGILSLANAVSYLVAAGNVSLPGRFDDFGNIVPAYSWVEEFISECESFPRGEFNDQVASLSHLLYWFHERPLGGADDWSDMLEAGEKEERLPTRKVF